MNTKQKLAKLLDCLAKALFEVLNDDSGVGNRRRMLQKALIQFGILKVSYFLRMADVKMSPLATKKPSMAKHIIAVRESFHRFADYMYETVQSKEAKSFNKGVRLLLETVEEHLAGAAVEAGFTMVDEAEENTTPTPDALSMAEQITSGMLLSGVRAAEEKSKTDNAEAKKYTMLKMSNRARVKAIRAWADGLERCLDVIEEEDIAGAAKKWMTPIHIVKKIVKGELV